MRLMVRAIGAAALIAVICTTLLLARNDWMEKGAKALKEGNERLALQYFKPMARMGDKSAQFLVAQIYVFGGNGVPKSDPDAIYWFRRCGSIFYGLVALGNGDPAAPYELEVAKALADGTNGAKANPAESLKWLKLAAEGGNTQATEMLAKHAADAHGR